MLCTILIYPQNDGVSLCTVPVYTYSRCYFFYYCLLNCFTFTSMQTKDKWVIMYILQKSCMGKLYKLISYKLYSLRQYGPSAQNPSLHLSHTFGLMHSPPLLRCGLRDPGRYTMTSLVQCILQASFRFVLSAHLAVT